MNPQPPPDLSDASQAAWADLAADVAEATDGAAVDFGLLADMLRARDRLVAVGAAIDAEGVTVSGSKGQTRPHPLLAVEANLRREVGQLMDRLNRSPQRRGGLRVDRKGRPWSDW